MEFRTQNLLVLILQAALGGMELISGRGFTIFQTNVLDST